MNFRNTGMIELPEEVENSPYKHDEGAGNQSFDAQSATTTASTTKTTSSIDHEQQRYPYCLVWTSLPGISQILPIIGHTGIAGYVSTCQEVLTSVTDRSDGKIHDFAGSYYISVS